MEGSLLIKIGLLLLGVAVLVAGVTLAYNYFRPGDEEAPDVMIISPDRRDPPEPIEQPPRSVIEGLDLTPESESDLEFMLPRSDEEGQPFVLTAASEHANNAFKALREKRFQQAVMEYRRAAELDPRYEASLRRTENLVENIRTLGFERVKNQRVFPGDRLTYKQLYGWD